MKKMMMIAAVAAAGAAMAAGLGPQNYVQDGLVTHFDAIDNEGTGTHNPSATTWRDLKGSAYITLLTGASWTNRYFDSTATMHTIKTMPGYDRTSLTMEAPVNVISNGASGNYPRIFSNGESFSIYFAGVGTTAQLYFNGQSPDTRPNFASFRIGTVYAFGSSTCYGIGLNGVQRSATSVPVKVAITKPAADWTLNGSGGGYLHGHYYGLRFYNRSLSQAELRANAEVDGLRFFSYTYTGTGAAVNWSAIPWVKPEGKTDTAPSTDKTAYAQVANAIANVAASDNVKLAGLSLEDGATLNVPSGAEAFLDVLYVEGQAVQAGRYTGTGSVGTQVSWISGAGVVRVGDDGFLQATGNQAINTGYFVKPSTRIVVDYAFTSATPTQQRVFGAASDDASAGLSCAHYINGSGYYAWALQDGKGNWQSLDVTATTDRRTLDLDSYNSQVRLLTGTTVTKSSTFSTKRTNTAAWPLAIFANCTGASGTTFNNYGKVKLYSFAIYEEGVLKHAYLPYRSADETVVGLKDLMTGNILVKAVGSAFSSGDNINSDPVWRSDDYRCYTGTGATENWSDIAWSMPFGRATVPAASSFSLTNMCVDISNAKVNVAASDKLGLWQLSLTNGATLNVASDAVVAVKTVSVEGVAVPRGIYTGTGSVGTQASWLEGAGVVRVAGSRSAEIPDTIPTPAGDGWYEFGITSANGGRTWRPNNWYIVADWPKWDRILFPAGARVRFVGYTILDTIPSGVFSEVDFTSAEYILLHGKQVFADGSPFTIPSGVTLRYQPGNWVPQSNPDEYKLTTDGSGTMTTPLNVVGTLYVYGDGTHLARQEYSGLLTGNGEFKFGNFGNQARFMGGFAFNGKVTGYQNGQLLWVDSLAVTSSISGVTFSDCGNTYQTNSSHNVNGIFFGKHNSDATADHEFYIASVYGNARDITDKLNKRWRCGGALGIWGGNTMHVGNVKHAVHVVGRPQDLGCSAGWFSGATGKGIGNLVVDESSAASSLFLSTNVNVKVGKVTAATCFNYTYHSNVVNGTTLDITNSCLSTATVNATDIGMLPMRISGFKGTVTLTDTATKSYEMPIDFTHGTNYLYNTVGCIGSGTLGSAPASGTIDATFPTTGDAPVKGDYALARFTSGGDLLAGWTVTLNGQAVDSAIVSGMKVEVRKDATGLWLKVDKPGVTIIIR